MDRVRKLIHAEREDVSPYTGAGVTVAILDTGIAMHPDFADRVIGFRDFVGTSRMPYDDCGHGTHVAGCLCGSGACSGGLYAGVAPGCRILSGKVLDEKGDGTMSNMAAGIEWILDNQELYQIKILNISVSMEAKRSMEAKHSMEARHSMDETEHVRMMQYLVACLERVWDAGIFVVVAAGNRGPAAGSISPLGASRKVVTVGCHDGIACHGRKNSCEAYSGRGPAGTELKKPDIVAPGTDIMSCSAGFRQTVRGCRDAYIVKNGTSMSTPLVAGAAALCLQKYPEYSNEQIKRRILWSAADLGEAWSKQGWGMLDVEIALR